MKRISFGLFLIICGIFTIAASVLGGKCCVDSGCTNEYFFNVDRESPEECNSRRKSSYWVLIFNMILGICLLAAGGLIITNLYEINFVGFRTPKYMKPVTKTS